MSWGTFREEGATCLAGHLEHESVFSGWALVGVIGSGFGGKWSRGPRGLQGAPLPWLGKVMPALPTVAFSVKWSRLRQSAGSSWI